MEGRINKIGCLEIKRKDIFIAVSCFRNRNLPFCRQACALFGEPRTINDGSVHLSLCHKVLVFESFEDERE